MTKKTLQLFIFIFIAFPAGQHLRESQLESSHLLMGNPSSATFDSTVSGNFLMVKSQYALSYDAAAGIPNWVAWHLDSTWFGEVKRSNNFRRDSTLPAQWYRVHEGSYRKSGYDRGHLCPSGDRTNTPENNSITYLMTNIIPQVPNNNQGPWAALELYCRNLVRQGKELYIYAGGSGSAGSIDSGRIRIPEQTWKTVLILESGDYDLQRVTPSTIVFAVIMPNSNQKLKKQDDWEAFIVSIDSVEAVTGFNFYTNIPGVIQESIEKISHKNFLPK